MVDRAYGNLNPKFVDNQDAHEQIENDETGQPIYSEDTEPTEHSPQVHESNLAPGELLPKMPSDDKIAVLLVSLIKNNIWCLMCYISGI